MTMINILTTYLIKIKIIISTITILYMLIAQCSLLHILKNIKKLQIKKRQIDKYR